MKFTLDLQFFESKKDVGSTKNQHDSNQKYLGAKKADDQFVKVAKKIYLQRGKRIYPEKNVGMGCDNTLFALVDGIAKYKHFKNEKTKTIVLNK